MCQSKHSQRIFKPAPDRYLKQPRQVIKYGERHQH
jgi:hypothetical protein